MPVPLTIYPLISFLGTEEGLNHILVPEVYSPSDSINVWADKFGRIKKILGSANLNATAIVTNAASHNTAIVNLVAYIPEGSSYTSQKIIAQVVSQTNGQNELWLSSDNGATWTFLATGPAAGNVPYDFAQYRGDLLIARPGQAVQVYDGSSVATAGETQSPTITSSASASGTNLKGTYQWKLLSMIGTTRKRGSVASTALSLDGEQGSLTWTADADTNVTGYELYRTTGTGGIYYFVTAIDGRTTAAYTDNTADRVILANRALQEYGDAPPSGVYYAEIHKERAWYARTSSAPNRIWYSDPGRPESVGTLSYVDVNDAEEQISTIQGLTGGYEGRLIVWTAEGIFAVSGTGAVINGVPDLYVRKTSAAQGTLSGRTVVRVPAGALYRDPAGKAESTDKVTLAYMSPLGDFRIFDGERDWVVSGSIDSINYQSSFTDCFHALHDEDNGLVIWFYWEAGTTFAGTVKVVVWNYGVGTWHHWTEPQVASALTIQTSSTPTYHIGGCNTASGKVRVLFSGNVDPAGAGFTGRWASNTLYGKLGEATEGIEVPLPAPHLVKRWRWVEAIMEANDAGDVMIKVYPANGIADGTQAALIEKSIIATSSTQYSGRAKIQLKDATGRFPHQRGLRIVVEDNASTLTPWALEGLVVAYSPLAGTKRDRGQS